MKKIAAFFKGLKDHPLHIAILSGVSLVLVAAIVLAVIFANPFTNEIGSSSNSAVIGGSSEASSNSSSNSDSSVGSNKPGKTTSTGTPVTGGTAGTVNSPNYTWPDIAPSDAEAGKTFATLLSAPKSSFDMRQFLLTSSKNTTLPFNVACNITADSITAVIPAGVNIGSMKVNFSYTGKEVKMGNTTVKSDSTVFDFTKPVTLTLVPKSGSSKTVTVYVMTLNTGIPSMSIKTTNLAAISSKDTYAGCSIYAGGGSKTVCSYAPSKIVSANGKVKGRGWTSWYSYPKKSYSLSFNAKQALFDLPASDEWVLAANFADRTLLRNTVAEQLATNFGLQTIMHVRPVDLWINGAYIGNYQLVQKIKIAKDSVNITSFDPSKAPDKIGYIIETNGHDKADEFQKYTNGQATTRPSLWKPFGSFATLDPVSGDIFFPSKHESSGYKSVFVVDKPSITSLNTISSAKAQTYVKYIYDYIDQMETAISSKKYANASTYLDMDAMAKWYLVEETTMNTDSKLHASCYMYKDAGGKMKMGPVWDFDLGLGNGQYANETMTGQTYLDNSTWFKDLMTMPEFKAAVKKVWNTNRSKLNNLPSYIDGKSAMLQKSQAVNFRKWDIAQEALWTNPNAITYNYDDNVNFVKDFMSARINYMDSKISNW